MPKAQLDDPVSLYWYMASWLLCRAGLCIYLSAHRTTARVLAYEIGGESIVNRGNLPPMHPSQRGAPVCSLLTKLGPTKPAEIRPVVQQVHAPATDDAASPLCRYKTGSVISETRGMPLWAERCACHLAPPGCSRAEVALPLAFDKTTKAGKAFSTLNNPAMQGDRAPQLAAARKSHLASMARSRSNGFARDWSKPPVQQHVRLPFVTHPSLWVRVSSIQRHQMSHHTNLFPPDFDPITNQAARHASPWFVC